MEPIAYTGTDRQLYVLDELGGSPRRLSDDAAASYVWPTWAPGRAALAAMRRPRGTTDEQPSVELWLGLPYAAREPTSNTTFAPPRRVWAAHDGGPICLGWAPAARHLGMLVQEGNDLH